MKKISLEDFIDSIPEEIYHIYSSLKIFFENKNAYKIFECSFNELILANFDLMSVYFSKDTFELKERLYMAITFTMGQIMMINYEEENSEELNNENNSDIEKFLKKFMD